MVLGACIEQDIIILPFRDNWDESLGARDTVLWMTDSSSDSSSYSQFSDAESNAVTDALEDLADLVLDDELSDLADTLTCTIEHEQQQYDEQGELYLEQAIRAGGLPPLRAALLAASTWPADQHWHNAAHSAVLQWRACQSDRPSNRCALRKLVVEEVSRMLHSSRLAVPCPANCSCGMLSPAWRILLSVVAPVNLADSQYCGLLSVHGVGRSGYADHQSTAACMLLPGTQPSEDAARCVHRSTLLLTGSDAAGTSWCLPSPNLQPTAQTARSIC